MAIANPHKAVHPAASFKHDLESGVSLDDALDATHRAGDHRTIVAGAVEMLAADGVIDMKRLAKQVGVSRASLYRHFPDRCQLESEVAARAARGMAAAVDAQPDRPAKLRALAEYLVAHPGEAAAIVRLAAEVRADLLRLATGALTGAAADTAWVLGFAVMAATPGRSDADVAALQASIYDLVGEIS